MSSRERQQLQTSRRKFFHALFSDWYSERTKRLLIFGLPLLGFALVSRQVGVFNTVTLLAVIVCAISGALLYRRAALLVETLFHQAPASLQALGIVLIRLAAVIAVILVGHAVYQSWEATADKTPIVIALTLFLLVAFSDEWAKRRDRSSTSSKSVEDKSTSSLKDKP